MVAGKNAAVSGSKAVERQNPAGGGELGSPDRVELEDVGIARTGVEPLHVELMALVGGVGGAALLDPDVGMLAHEPRELAPQHLPLGAEHAAGHGDRGRSSRWGGPTSKRTQQEDGARHPH